MRECPLEREMDEGRLDGKAGLQFSAGQQVRGKKKGTAPRCVAVLPCPLEAIYGISLRIVAGRRNESVDIAAAIRFSTNAFLGHSEKEEEGVGQRQRFKGVISRWRVLAPPVDDGDWIK